MTWKETALKINRSGPVSAFLALLLLATSLLSAADTDLSHRSLRGLNNVSVVIEDLPAGAQTIGLFKESLQTDVELRLRQNGIKGSEDALAYIYVNVNVSQSGAAAALSVEVHQTARLTPDPSIAVVATTWDADAVVSNPQSAAFVRDSIVGLIDKFLNAWPSVNPKTR